MKGYMPPNRLQIAQRQGPVICALKHAGYRTEGQTVATAGFTGSEPICSRIFLDLPTLLLLNSTAGIMKLCLATLTVLLPY